MVTSGTTREARAHHYVPQCWLAGFTESGQKNGTLWVSDLRRRKQWPTTPPNAGHRRDFYRLSSPVVDPVVVEKFYSKLEDGIAPILRALDQELRNPTMQELEVLCAFIALQWTRVPAFRPKMLRIAEKVNRATMDKVLKNPESWRRTLKKMKVSLDAPEADYHKMREFVESGQYNLSADDEWYVKQSLEGAEAIIPTLLRRHWQTLTSQKGSFIGSDNPVALDGERRKMIGFANAEVIIFPISKHVVLYGTLSRIRSIPTTEMLIARLNTMAMLHAHEQVFSRRPDFCWLDEAERYQTGWTSFEREKYHF